MASLINHIDNLWDRIWRPGWYNGNYISSNSPIIIGGCARSGTTLMRVILDSHSNIFCGPESNIFLPLRIRTRKCIKNLSWKFDVSVREIRNLLDDSRCSSEFIEKFFIRVSNLRGKKRWGDKSPKNVLRLNDIFKHFPRAKFIHMIRDGRDVACSLRTFPKRKMVDGKIIPLNTDRPIEDCIKRWVHDVNIGRKYRGDPRYIEVKYEDLIFITEKTLKELFMFLEETFEKKILRYYEVQDSTREITKFPQNIEAMQPMYNKSVSRWRKELDDEEIRLFKKLGGSLLINLGYEDDDNW